MVLHQLQNKMLYTTNMLHLLLFIINWNVCSPFKCAFSSCVSSNLHLKPSFQAFSLILRTQGCFSGAAQRRQKDAPAKSPLETLATSRTKKPAVTFALLSCYCEKTPQPSSFAVVTWFLSLFHLHFYLANKVNKTTAVFQSGFCECSQVTAENVAHS